MSVESRFKEGLDRSVAILNKESKLIKAVLCRSRLKLVMLYDECKKKYLDIASTSPVPHGYFLKGDLTLKPVQYSHQFTC